jgi:hypothetical protein
MPYPLGRDPKTPDPRDANYPPERLEAMIAAGVAVPLDRKVYSILDQGTNGTCVAAGTLGALNTANGGPKFTSADIVPFFLTIPGAGPLPDGGAQVRDGLQKAKDNGWLLAYSALTTEAQITSWIENHGPVVYGTDWYEGMFTPDPDGTVHISGTVQGGHCYYGHGDLSGFDNVNSWGASWGAAGHFNETRPDFQKLLDEGGEAWAIVVPAPQPVPVPTPTPPTPDGCLVAALRPFALGQRAYVRKSDRVAFQAWMKAKGYTIERTTQMDWNAVLCKAGAVVEDFFAAFVVGFGTAAIATNINPLMFGAQDWKNALGAGIVSVFYVIYQWARTRNTSYGIGSTSCTL